MDDALDGSLTDDAFFLKEECGIEKMDEGNYLRFLIRQKNQLHCDSDLLQIYDA
jgi:hypothetical protein